MESKKTVWIVVLVVAVLVIAGCGVFIYMYFRSGPALPYSAAPTVSDSTETQAPETDDPSAAPTEAPTELEPYGYEMSAESEAVELSFDELMEINPDIYAWIYVPGTDVDYPVVQSIQDGEDSFYLDHNIYREYQFSGSIYAEIQNKLDFSDPVTVLYGHNMLNGSMFATLHRFEDEDFFDENNTIFIYTKDKILTYFIYSAYTFDDRHILNSYDMNDEESFTEYLDSTLDPRSYNCNIREGVTLTTDDKILTLSTCTNGGGNTRYLVQGVLVNEQPRE